MKLARIVETAGKEPADGKTQIAQLLAIRWLGENSEQTKKDAKARALLEDIAAGKKAQDPQGFAKEYAERSLALLDGKKPAVAKMPENSIRDGLAWFPERTSYFAALDLRGFGDKQGDESAIRKVFSSNMPPAARNEFYSALETLGNVRIDRISFGYSAEPKQEAKDQIYVRFTGKGDPKRVAAFFKGFLRNLTTTEEKGPKGVPLLLLQAEEPPAMFIVGDTDFIMVGYESDAEKHTEVRQLVLDVLKDGKQSVVTGRFAGDLKKVSANANGLLMGDLPERFRKSVADSVPATPKRIHVESVRDKDLIFRLQATMDDGDDAKKLVEKMESLKKLGLEALHALAPQAKIKEETVTLLEKSLSSLKVEAKGAEVSGGMTISANLIKALPAMLRDVFKRD